MDEIKPSFKWDLVYSKESGTPWSNGKLPLQALDRFLSLLRPRARVLDFGCGTGRIATFLDKRCFEVLAADCSQVALAKALPLIRGKYVQSQSLEDFASLEVDGIIIWGVLDHYSPQHWPIWLTRMSMCVKKGGIALVGVFDDTDAKFQGQRYRTSLTTGDLCWCANASEFFELTRRTIGVLEVGEKVRLKDGGATGVLRTWLYCICRVGHARDG